MDEHIKAGGIDYSYEELLLTLLKLHIEAFLERSEEYILNRLTVALEQYNAKVYKVLNQLKTQLGLSDETFYIMSHENAFFQYVIQFVGFLCTIVETYNRC